MTNKIPLVLDVDGTFLKTDLLYESFWAGLGRQPWAVIKTAVRNFRHPAKLKQILAQQVDLRLDLMPVHPDVAQMAIEARDQGRDVVFASASDENLVDDLAQVHGFDGNNFASDGQKNLKGAAKAQALVAAYGQGGFEYAGNETLDQKIWQEAGAAILIGHHPAMAKSLSDTGKPVREISGGWTAGGVLTALRPHQWVKNVLLFLPVIAAHDFTLSTLFLVLLGICAFSAAASSIYVVNDLLDLEADRLHPKKKHRPFASGAVPIRVGMVLSAVLGFGAIALAALISPAFLAVILTYMTLSLAYSLRLKRLRWIDIATLASLYTLRVVGGAAASGVDASVNMLIFIFPVFLSLGCVKRLTELTLATSDERLPGRGYGRPDRGDLLNVASLGTVAALLIFFLYSFSDQATVLYPTRWLIWAALIPIALWLIRMVVLGYQGKQDYDPIVFAMRDKTGLGLLMIALSLMFYAAGLWQQWFGL